MLKQKFLNIGKQKSFASFPKSLSGLVEKDNLFKLFKENFSQHKKKFILFLALFLISILFLLK